MRAFEPTPHDLKVCGRKRHYESKREADAHARRDANRYDKSPGRAYICPICGRWCLASPPGVAKRMKQKVKRKRVVKTHKVVRPYKPPPEF